jgi:carbon-monoxide dehydrogenase medium subunit
MRRHRDLERDPLVLDSAPLLSEAVRHVGNVRVRNRGTVGGSLAHGDPAAELPLAMAVLEASFEISSGTASRTVPAADFPVTYFTTQLADDELLVAVRVPKLAQGWGWGFREVSRRPGDFAIVAAAALVQCSNGVIREARLALGGISDRPIRSADVEAAAVGRTADELSAIVGEIGGIDPVTDTNATAEHRRRLARVLTVRALADACRRAGEPA